MNYCSFDLFSQWWQIVSKKICDLEEEKWGLVFLSGELAWVQFEMLFGDLSWSMNQKAGGGGEGSGEMVIFLTAEPRAALHSLGFLHFSCTVVLQNGTGVTLWHQSHQISSLRLSEIKCELCFAFNTMEPNKILLHDDLSSRWVSFITPCIPILLLTNSFAGWGIFNWRLKKQQPCDSACACVDESGGVSLTRGKTEYRIRDAACRWAISQALGTARDVPKVDLMPIQPSS